MVYDAAGNPQTIDWKIFLVDLQYFLPGGNAWVSANFSQMESGNILDYGTAPASVFKKEQFWDVNLFWNVTPAFRLGAEYASFKQTMGDDWLASGRVLLPLMDVLLDVGKLRVRQSQTIGETVLNTTKQKTRYTIELPSPAIDRFGFPSCKRHARDRARRPPVTAPLVRDAGAEIVGLPQARSNPARSLLRPLSAIPGVMGQAGSATRRPAQSPLAHPSGGLLCRCG